MIYDTEELLEKGRAAQELKRAREHLDEEKRLLEMLEAHIQNADRKRRQMYDPPK